MSGPIPLMPILDIKLAFVEQLQGAQSRKDASMMLLCVSILEYMKDAQRWQYVQNHYVEVLDADMGEMMPDNFRKWVDERIK
jgi:hypothetical protein